MPDVELEPDDLRPAGEPLALDLAPPAPQRRIYKPANPIIWGGVCGVLAGVIVVAGQMTGQHADNFLMANPYRAAGAAFAWGAAIALFRNWLSERRRGR